MTATRPTVRPLTRRRALSIVAAGAGVALLGLPPRAGGARLFEWKGTAMGARARIALYHPDRGEAERAVRACVAEIDRLEDQFSLYRPRSALSRLNRDGRLDGPSHDMILLLAACRRFGDLSHGAFDVTVQPLWRLYADYFAAHPLGARGPDREALRAALARVDYRRLEVTAGRITLPGGMAVTLNGIAQGYVTDRVAGLLRSRGWSNVLIDLGEIRALDGHADGRPWAVALRDGMDGGGRITVPLKNRAVATSGGAGTVFGPDGRHHHLFDPRTGKSGSRYRSVTVIARNATTADALSTALYVTPRRQARRLVGRGGAIEAWLTGADGRTERVTG